jgi:hypothetical protein
LLEDISFGILHPEKCNILLKLWIIGYNLISERNLFGMEVKGNKFIVMQMN